LGGGRTTSARFLEMAQKVELERGPLWGERVKSERARGGKERGSV